MERFKGVAQYPSSARMTRETLDNEAARIVTDLKDAADMQRAILPRAGRSGAFFDVHCTVIPCRAIGGDFFEYVDLPSGDFGFAVCDVAGKGAPAAVLSGVVQGIFFAQSRRGGGPAKTLERVSEDLLHRAIDSRFATMFYGVLSKDGRLTFCNAGHNPPLLLNSGGTRRLETGGPMLGVFDKNTYQEETVELQPSDLIVAFSDGIPEALNVQMEEFGDERLLSCVELMRTAEPPRVVQTLLATVRDFCGRARQSDDVTALGLRYTR